MRFNTATAAGLQVLAAADYMGTVDAGGALGLFGCTIWTTPPPPFPIPPEGGDSGWEMGCPSKTKSTFQLKVCD